MYFRLNCIITIFLQCMVMTKEFFQWGKQKCSSTYFLKIYILTKTILTATQILPGVYQPNMLGEHFCFPLLKVQSL